MSMYASYLKERTTDEILETEKGFATFRYLNDFKSVYIIDIYVRPDFRNHNVAGALADTIVEMAKASGAKELLGTVAPSAKNSTDSLKVLLAYGMKLHSAGPDWVVFRKDI